MCSRLFHINSLQVSHSPQRDGGQGQRKRKILVESSFQVSAVAGKWSMSVCITAAL